VFTDRHRWLKILLPCALLLGLCAHYAHLAATLSIGWRACMAAPAESDGDELRFPLYEVSSIVGPERYTISKTLRDIPVEGPTAGLAAGMTVSVLASFRASDQVAVESHREVHWLRGAKKLLGIVGLLWALWVLPGALRWSGGRLVERG
jgi:hypothetical protein